MVHVEHIQVNYIPEKFQGVPIEKPGNRIEYPLDLQDDLVQSVQKQLAIGMPLRFASLIEAKTTNGPSQNFHKDTHSGGRTNAIVYLTNVPDISYGPLEIESVGPILGTKGTAIVYPGNEVHRGVANRTEVPRMALALAFSDSDEAITTIGAPVVTNNNNWAWIVGTLAIVGILYIIWSAYNMK